MQERLRGSLHFSFVTWLGIHIATLTTLCGFASLAQGQVQQPDLTIDIATRSAVIEGVLKNLNDYYVFPEIAKQMENAVRERIQDKEYERTTSAKELAAVLTRDLQEVSHDKHLRVLYRHEPIPLQVVQTETPEDRLKRLDFLRSLNFGFEKVERLNGNIGYLDLRGFIDPEVAGDTAVAAMNSVANTEALIIDLRNNTGGTPAMGVLLASYLFDAEPVHYADNYTRVGNITRQWWTLPYVPGKRYGTAKAVYILTSKRTFSAAEDFAYHLKNLKRATTIGEVTGGGANLTDSKRISNHFMLLVPVGRGISPITGTNWEGVGVKPDVEVPAQQALKVAHLTALSKILQNVSDAARKEQLKNAIESAQRELDELKKKQ